MGQSSTQCQATAVFRHSHGCVASSLLYKVSMSLFKLMTKIKNTNRYAILIINTKSIDHNYINDRFKIFKNKKKLYLNCTQKLFI